MSLPYWAIGVSNSLWRVVVGDKDTMYVPGFYFYFFTPLIEHTPIPSDIFDQNCSLPSSPWKSLEPTLLSTRCLHWPLTCLWSGDRRQRHHAPCRCWSSSDPGGTRTGRCWAQLQGTWGGSGWPGFPWRSCHQAGLSCGTTNLQRDNKSSHFLSILSMVLWSSYTFIYHLI